MQDPTETPEQQLDLEMMESTQALPELDRDTAIEVLPALCRAADDILGALRTELKAARQGQPETDILTDSDRLLDNSLLANLRANSRFTRAMVRNEENFKKQLAVFIPSDAEFILPSKILDAVFGGQSNPDKSHVAVVNAVIFKANAAALVCLLRRSFLDPHSDEAIESIKLLDALFPTPYFVQSFARAQSDPSHSALYTKSLELCIETRTLVALFAMEMSQSPEDCLEVLDGVFYEEKGADGDRTLRFWDSSQAMPEGATSAINERMDMIKQLCYKVDYLPQLWNAFSWEKYLKAALRWIDCRNVELTSGLAFHGGVEIVDDLLLQPLPVKPKKRSVKYFQEHRAYNFSAPRATTKRQPLSAFDSQPQAQQTQFETPVYDILRSAMDSQQNPIEKRALETDPTYVDHDSQPELKKRRRAPGRPAGQTADATLNYVIASPGQRKASKLQLKKPTQEEIEAQRRLAVQVGVQHLQTQQQSRAQTQRARAATGRVAGAARSKWTTEETGGLYGYITREGTSWAHIKSIDDAGAQLLTLRSQVDLKDKARNMKFDILKAGLPLPPNFESVPLAKAMREKLESMGRLAPAPATAGVNDLIIAGGGLPPLPYGQPAQQEEDDEEDAFENKNLTQESDF
jgi:hypothetical protein